MAFQEAVEEAVPHGCVLLKSLWSNHGPDVSVLMPWQFGVYLESEPDFDKQEAICEVTYLLPEQLWRRISHRPDARELFRRCVNRARKQSMDEVFPGFINQVILGGSQPYVQDEGAPLAPGGTIGLTGIPPMAMLPAEVAEGLIRAYQVWVVNDETGDYTTIQIIDPDIVIAPRYQRLNLFIPYEHPFSPVKINPQANYVFGRSELHPLIKLQSLLRDRTEDIKKIMGLQYDRIRAFIGFSGINDDRMDELHSSGWLAEENPMAKIQDITPELPPNAFEEMKMIIQFFDDIAGFDNVLSGKGEPGIRSGSHFQGAVRQASPRLRDRAVRVERQNANFAEKNLWLMASKDPRAHWTQS
ncbi:MAG TPA: hypothetical protein VMT58_09060, partial [Candidatus Binataceae bacterium]|nr:hypothetical protein [Candidatus Binataceae bacterium]